MTLASRWVSVRDAAGGNLTPEAEHRDIRAGLFTLMGEAASVTQSNKRTRCNVIFPPNRPLFNTAPDDQKFPKNWKAGFLSDIFQEMQGYCRDHLSNFEAVGF